MAAPTTARPVSSVVTSSCMTSFRSSFIILHVFLAVFDTQFEAFPHQSQKTELQNSRKQCEYDQPSESHVFLSV